MPGSRCQVPRSRCQVPRSRCQMPGSRCHVPGSKCQVSYDIFTQVQNYKLRIDFIQKFYFAMIAWLWQFFCTFSKGKGYYIWTARGSLSQAFLSKGALKISGKFTEQHSCQSAISINLLKSHFGMDVLL